MTNNPWANLSQEEIEQMQQDQSARELRNYRPAPISLNQEQDIHPIQEVFDFAEDLLGWTKEQTIAFFRNTLPQNTEGVVPYDGGLSDWTTCTGLLKWVKGNLLHDAKQQGITFPTTHYDKPFQQLVQEAKIEWRSWGFEI